LVYKIGLIGTHGTGKTALAGLAEGELKRRGIEVTSVREISTQARKFGLPINEQTTIHSQLWILHQQFAEELALSHKVESRPQYDVIICDRGPDNYCYLKNSVGEDSYALALTLGHLKKFPYAKLYLLPIVEQKIADDGGTRALCSDFQRKMDREVREFLRERNISFIELPLPQAEDQFRNEWVRIIVNQTLLDLNKPERYHIK